jgi:hypothetical protein
MMSDKIYVDASQPATLRHSGHSVECPTLQEAVIAWRTLPDKDRHQATIQVLGGPLYSADEIDRLYHEPKRAQNSGIDPRQIGVSKFSMDR